MIRVTGLKVAVEEDTKDLRRPMAELLRIPPSSIKSVEVVRRALDARKKSQFYFVYTLDAVLSDAAESSPSIIGNPAVRPAETRLQPALPRLKLPPSTRTFVVGMGPAGLFAALTLARSGVPATVLERGREVEARVRDIGSFWGGGPLDPESNVQFGEGGAGTFSDGKLTTRIDDPRVRDVLGTLVDLGAPDEILYEYRPHVGTDRLRSVIRNFRTMLLDMGVEMRFSARVSGVEVKDGGIAALMVGDERVDARSVVLAPGNAARDTYDMLMAAGVAMSAKPFAVGLRIEHPRPLIDRAQYGRYAGHKALGPAEYMLTHQDKRTGRAAYSFCMCPGGQVVAAASEEGGVVVNGMSNYKRGSGSSNSALVVTVTPDDFGTAHPLGGVEFQRKFERAAFREGGSDYSAPAQDLGSFLSGRPGGDVNAASYRPGVRPSDLTKCLPTYVTETLKDAIAGFDRRVRGFGHPAAVLTGVETRTSSPVRIQRGLDCQSVSVKGLYPCGEGSGYAGGIVSSAVDGIKAAECLVMSLQAAGAQNA